jgi:hypothetical protein
MTFRSPVSPALRISLDPQSSPKCVTFRWPVVTRILLLGNDSLRIHSTCRLEQLDPDSDPAAVEQGGCIAHPDGSFQHCIPLQQRGTAGDHTH